MVSNHIKEGIEWALEYNYQTPGLEKYPFASLLQEVSTMPWGVGAALMPFPKFLFNAMRYMYQHSAIATPFTAFHVGKRNLKRAELGPLTSFEKEILSPLVGISFGKITVSRPPPLSVIVRVKPLTE